MATAIASDSGVEIGREGKTRRLNAGGRRRSQTRGDNAAVARFFLGKVVGRTPVLEREVASENEAMIESLKAGQTYYVISEWRAVADLSGKAPRVGREGVKREERDRAAPGGPRAAAPSQAS